MRLRLLALLLVPLAVALTAAQGPAPAGPPVDPEARFEVVSIKPFDASGGATPRISMTPGRYDVGGVSLLAVVTQALRLPPNRLFGLPDWVGTERYTIAATIPAGASPASLFAMLTNLLKDRFNLVMHTDTREMPVYHLVMARSDRRFGSALNETSAECRTVIAARLEAAQRGEPVPAAPPGPRGCGEVSINVGMARFSGVVPAGIAGILTPFAGRTVIDKTGLTGSYDFTLKWTPDAGIGNPAPFGLPPGGAPSSAPQPSADPDAPNIFTAVQEQLGLKLESARGPVPVVVVDRIDKPSLD